MSYLYRTPLVLTRKQPYVDWANSTGGEPMMTLELAATPAMYAVAEPEHEEGHEQTLEQIIESRWAEIFEYELAGWIEDDATWPIDRSLEMFDEWFKVTLGHGIFDLDPLMSR